MYTPSHTHVHTNRTTESSMTQRKPNHTTTQNAHESHGLIPNDTPFGDSSSCTVNCHTRLTRNVQLSRHAFAFVSCTTPAVLGMFGKGISIVCGGSPCRCSPHFTVSVETIRVPRGHGIYQQQCWTSACSLIKKQRGQ